MNRCEVSKLTTCYLGWMGCSAYYSVLGICEPIFMKWITMILGIDWHCRILKLALLHVSYFSSVQWNEPEMIYFMIFDCVNVSFIKINLHLNMFMPVMLKNVLTLFANSSLTVSFSEGIWKNCVDQITPKEPLSFIYFMTLCLNLVTFKCDIHPHDTCQGDFLEWMSNPILLREYIDSLAKKQCNRDSLNSHVKL